MKSAFISRAGTALALLLCASFARAGISEIKTDFVNQTGPFGPSPVFTTGTAADGNYMLCVGFDSATPPVTATLEWTDENANPQQWSPSGVQNCTALRNRAGATVYVSTSGSSGNYSLAVFGFGLWPEQPQKQAGLTEVPPGSIAAGDYIFLVTEGTADAICTGTASLTIPGYGSMQIDYPWSIIFPFRASAGTLSFAPPTGSEHCLGVTFNALHFGKPGTGAGPLKDWEVNLIQWTNATYPNWKDMNVDQGGPGILASNIAEVPNDGSLYEVLQVYWGTQGAVLCAASLGAPPSGAPAACASPFYLGGQEFRTLNGNPPFYGESPTYSVEVAVIEF
jgi:hypothetical protein